MQQAVPRLLSKWKSLGAVCERDSEQRRGDDAPPPTRPGTVACRDWEASVVGGCSEPGAQDNGSAGKCSPSAGADAGFCSYVALVRSDRECQFGTEGPSQETSTRAHARTLSHTLSVVCSKNAHAAAGRRVLWCLIIMQDRTSYTESERRLSCQGTYSQRGEKKKLAIDTRWRRLRF